MNDSRLSRRDLCKLTAAAALGSGCVPRLLLGGESAPTELGAVIGQPDGAEIGMRILADGGNAIDAIVAAALTAAVTAPASTGIGGFGLSAVIAHDGGTRLAAIDGNSAAPAAMRADTFRPGPDGKLPEGIDETPVAQQHRLAFGRCARSPRRPATRAGPVWHSSFQ